MSEQASSKTRARDIDRAQTCALLDAGYSEGQLDATEHQTRTTQAMKAKRLGELAALVSDLQIPDHLVEATLEATPAPRGRVPGRAVAAIVVAVVAVCGTVVYTSRGDAAPEAIVAAEPGPAPVPPGEPQPIVIEHLDPVSPEGIRGFLRLYEHKFGDLQVDEVTFYPEYVYFVRMLDGQPHREQEWSFNDGFSPSGKPDARTLDTVAVDLAALDVDRLAEVIATGAEQVGMSTGQVSYIFVRHGSASDDGLVSVQFSDAEERSGSVNTHLDGSVVEVFRAEGR